MITFRTRRANLPSIARWAGSHRSSRDLSTILGPDRTRLSKRHGATSMESFREMGILPEALRNYLALLGWSPADGKTEILGAEELVQQFSLDHITKSPAVFDTDKLNWLNRHYLKSAHRGASLSSTCRFLQGAGQKSAQNKPGRKGSDVDRTRA